MLNSTWDVHFTLRFPWDQTTQISVLPGLLFDAIGVVLHLFFYSNFMGLLISVAIYTKYAFDDVCLQFQEHDKLIESKNYVSAQKTLIGLVKFHIEVVK